MAFTTLHTVFLFLFFFILISLPPSSSAKLSFSKIFAFGDSYTDTGNTRSGTGPYSYGYVSNLPYGTTFFHHSTNRYSDGRLVIDFIATNLSLPFLSPYLRRNSDFSHGVNFAVAGSTALDHSFFVDNNITIAITPQSLQTQLEWFAEYLAKSGCQGRSKQCHEKFADALFWIGEIGANDYAYSFASSVSPNVVQDLVLKNVFKFLEVFLKPLYHFFAFRSSVHCNTAIKVITDKFLVSERTEHLPNIMFVDHENKQKDEEYKL